MGDGCQVQNEARERHAYYRCILEIRGALKYSNGFRRVDDRVSKLDGVVLRDRAELLFADLA